MNEEQETQQRVEQRLREAAPPVPQASHSVWPAVQERLQPRPRTAVRPLMWAGAAATACAALCVVWMTGHSPQIPPAALNAVPLTVQVTKSSPTPTHKHLHHMPRVRKAVIAVQNVHPHPSHIAYRKIAEPPTPEQTPLPDKETNTPRLRPAAAAPHPVLVKPVE